MSERASVTAEYMALFRALESMRPARSRLFYDPYAPIFLHGWRRAVWPVAQIGPGHRAAERLLDRNAPGARASGIARTKWIDDAVTEALEIAPQLVLLGAGYDTRAYRLAAAQRRITFELDQAETSLAKQAALNSRAVPRVGDVRFVTIDFSSQSLKVLSDAGFDHEQPACFVWEGVTNYLSAEAIDDVLREVRRAAPGSTLIFTYVHRDVLDHPASYYGAERLTSRLRAFGEPWTFGLLPDEIEAFLSDRGLRLTADRAVADIWRAAGRPDSEIHGYEFYRIASASVPV
jgi:methyltransferase (TIGR00027 family)